MRSGKQVVHYRTESQCLHRKLYIAAGEGDTTELKGKEIVKYIVMIANYAERKGYAMGE